jgi:lactoylglutathione lyase
MVGTENEPNVKQAVPFFAVRSMQASLRFYLDGLGCVVKNKWVDDGILRWCWLQLDDAAIMLQEYTTEGHASWQPTGKVGEGVTISFQCRDALALYRQFTSRGLTPSRPFVGNGMWVTSLSDPDGYRLEFESVTDVPEDTQYASE